MNTVLRVDLQPRIGAILLADDFIHAGRAVPLFGSVINRQIVHHRGILQRQMDRLVFLMVRSGQIDRGIAIKADHAVRLRIVDLRRFVGFLQGRVVGMVMKVQGARPMNR